MKGEREEYERLAYSHLKKIYSDELGLKDYEKRIKRVTSRDICKKIADKIDIYSKIKGKKVLDVGSGLGGCCVELARLGGTVSGIEPEPEKIILSRRLAKIERLNIEFIKGIGESLPWKDNYFDIVTSNAVLEHVNDSSKCISEMVRVVKKGGIIYINCPNYLLPYEGHYRVIFPPMCPRFLARAYLKILGKKTGFFNYINYVTSYGIISQLRRYDVEIKNIGLSKTTEKLKDCCNVKSIIRRILIKTGFNPTIELIVKKR